MSNEKESVRAHELRDEDLIYPHKQSRVPGYLGYTPQYKFNCGHTYGYQTDKLSQKHLYRTYLQRSDQLPGAPGAVKLHNLVPQGDGNKKYFQQMVPGYTGFVPRLQTTFGSRYKEATEEAIQEFNARLLNTRSSTEQIRYYLQSAKQLKVREDFPRPSTAHPGIDLRYATAERSRHFADRRGETDAPTIGYKGHIPRQIEHDTGRRYTIWAERALNHATNDKYRRMQTLTKDIQIDKYACGQSKNDPENARPGIAVAKTSSQWSRYGPVYDKKGMIPKYMGYVPQLTFSLGSTYGDGTRAVPACFDTNGYASGRYNDRGPVMDRLTIKA